MPETELTAGTRLWYAFVCWFRVLFDPDFANRVWLVRDRIPAPELPAPPAPEPALTPAPAAPQPPAPPAKPDVRAALQLLALMQREGRLVDFLEEDIASFKDSDIGATARIVHEGCRKALRAHLSIEPIRTEQEGTTVTLQDGYDAALVKLTGNVRGAAPFKGALQHRGWRTTSVKLPELLDGSDPNIIAPAEVEL